jgi:hypothetical protein
VSPSGSDDLRPFIRSDGTIYVVFSFFRPDGTEDYKSFRMYPHAGDTVASAMREAMEYAHFLASEYLVEPELNDFEFVPALPTV